MGKGRRNLPPIKRKVEKGTENRKKMEKCVNTKVPGIVLWVTRLRPHGPYTLHRDHPDRKGWKEGKTRWQTVTRGNSRR